jgi:uncharacterized membrane protein
MLLGQQAIAAKNPSAQLPLSSLLPAMMMYLMVAVTNIWVGIGSIMARRWARALMLILSWSWLIIGIIGTATTTMILPQTLSTIPTQPGQPQVSSAVIAGVIVGMVIFCGIFLVIMPCVFIYFYSSRHVKATCEQRDPVKRWTDECPLPVLGLCAWMALAIPMLLAMCLVGRPVMAFFGVFFTGFPAALSYLAMGGLWAWCAWALYKLEARGWWVVLITMCFFTVSTVITFAHHDNIMEMYRLMDFPAAQLAQLKASPMLEGDRLVMMTTFSMGGFIAYLVYIRRYIRFQQ